MWDCQRFFGDFWLFSEDYCVGFLTFVDLRQFKMWLLLRFAHFMDLCTPASSHLAKGESFPGKQKKSQRSHSLRSFATVGIIVQFFSFVNNKFFLNCQII